MEELYRLSYEGRKRCCSRRANRAVLVSSYGQSGPAATALVPNRLKISAGSRAPCPTSEIITDLTRRGVRLQIAATVHDPSDPVGRLSFNVLATVAEFEADLISARTREGLAVAKANGRLKGKPPKRSADQEAHLVALLEAGERTGAEIAAPLGVARATVYRARARERAARIPTPG